MGNTQSLIPPNIDYGKISADKYSPDETYKTGALRIQNNALWKANQDIDVAEPWTPEHWDGTTLAAELSAVNSRMQCGNIQATTVSQNSYTDVPVTFEHAFPKAPIVVVSIYTNSTGSKDYGNIDVVVVDGSVSATGFTARFLAGPLDNGERVPSANWIAMAV